MSRFADFLKKRKFIAPKKYTLFFDFGSNTTRVFYNNLLAFNQATLLIVHKSTEEPVAFGDKAKKLAYKISPNFVIKKPIRNSLVADDDALKIYIKAILKQLGLKMTIFNNFEALVAIPAGASNFDRQIFTQVFRDLSFSKVNLCQKGEACFAHLKKNFKINNSFLLDFGHETTEMSLFVDGKSILEKTLRIGSKQLTKAVKKLIKQRYELQIDTASAELIKKELLCLRPTTNEKNKKIIIRGQDLLNSQLKSQNIEAQVFIEIAENHLKLINEEIKFVLADVDNDLLSLAFHDGIFLTGLGVGLKKIDQVLEDTFKVEVIVSNKPAIDLVKGLTLLDITREL